MEAKVYAEIDGSHTFVKKVIMEHYSHISEQDQENFNKIRVYNTVKEPLFNGIDVYYCLKKTKDNIKRMYNDLLDDEVLRKQKVDGINRPINLITEYGIIHACYLYKNDIAIMFQKFMREVIKQLKEKGVATVIEANRELGKVLEEERDHRREAERINRQNIQLQEVFHNPADMGDQERTELVILRRETQKQYYVYVVDWEYMNAKFWKKYAPKEEKKKIQPPKKNRITPLDSVFEGIDINSSDSELDETVEKVEKRRRKKYDITEPHPKGIQDSYSLYDVDLQELESDENIDYYFCIRPKEITEKKKEYFKFIRYIDIKDSKHYRNMIEIIVNGNVYNNTTSYPVNSVLPEYKNEEYFEKITTPDSDVFQKTYSEIIDARNSSFINIHKDILVNEKKERCYVK